MKLNKVCKTISVAAVAATVSMSAYSATPNVLGALATDRETVFDSAYMSGNGLNPNTFTEQVQFTLGAGESFTSTVIGSVDFTNFGVTLTSGTSVGNLANSVNLTHGSGNTFSWLQTSAASPTFYSLNITGVSRTYSPIYEVRLNGIAAPVPEPETYAMLLAGLGMIGAVARRRDRKVLTA